MATTRTRNSKPHPLRIDTSANHAAVSILPSQTIQAPKPQRPASQMQIYHLDGTPYGMKPKPRKTIVAKDMYDGQEPPQYKPKASYTDLRQTSTLTSQPSTSCATCGKQRSSTDLNSRNINSHNECNTCGKRKVITPEPAPGILLPPQIRSVSEASSSTLINTDINDSTENITPAPKRKCVKCGRAKRPITLASPPAATTNTTTLSQSQTSTPEPNGLSFPKPPPTTHIASQHIMYTSTPPPQPTSVVPKRKPIPSQLMPGFRPLEVPTRTPVNIDIGIIPATATSEHAQPNLLHDTPVSISQKPLIPTPAGHSPPKPRRSTSISSIASSITRSLTRRRRSNDSNTSNTVPEHNESNAGRLINMISSAIRGEADSSYARLEEDVDRRTNRSPFSFVSKVDDNAAIKLSTLPHQAPSVPTTAATTPDLKQISRPSSSSSTYSNPSVKTPFADPTTTTSQPPESKSLLASLSQVTTPSRPTSLLPAHTAPELPTLSTLPTPPPVPQDDIFLATRPTELTRFKSLRSGVSRASSVARSTSLKRLGSLKAAPQLWYRTDMAIEGAAVGVY